MKLFTLFVMTLGFHSSSFAQNGSFDWVVILEQGDKIQKFEIPTKGMKKFQDYNGQNCIFAYKSEEKMGTRFTEFRAKLECKKGRSSSSSEYSCLDSDLEAKPEIVKLKPQKAGRGFSLQKITVPAANKKDLKGMKIETGSGLVMEPNDKGEFTASSQKFSPRWDKNGRQRIGSGTSAINGMTTKTTIECVKSK